jgi:predicted CoA-binding protein
MNPKNFPITLVVGASKNPERYSFKAIQSLVANGYPVLAFGLRNETIHNVEVKTDLHFTEPIHTITMYVGPDRQSELIPQLLKLNPHRIIFNPGTENPLFIQQAQQQGIKTELACTLVLLSTGQYNS